MHLSSLAHMISLVLSFGDEEYRNVSQMGDAVTPFPMREDYGDHCECCFLQKIRSREGRALVLRRAGMNSEGDERKKVVEKEGTGGQK